MQKWLLIALGSAIGGVARYGLSNGVYLFLSRDFPYGTLVVNVLGCFIMGLLFVLLLERVDGIADYLRAFLLIGVLGGFTTFSSFSIETFNLFTSGETLRAMLNIFGSVILCLSATWLGAFLGEKL